MKMKKIIYTLLGMMLSVGAWAQTSLQEQINSAADGATITLTGDVTITTVDELTITKTITLDLAGYTITSTVEEPIYVKASGNLTITGNGKIVGPEDEEGKARDGHAMITVEGGTLTFLNGTLTCGGVGSDGMYGVYILNGGTAVFGEEAGKTGPTITSWFAAIGENNTTAPANITVYGGSYTALASPSDSDWWSYFCAPIYAAGSGDIDIYDGSFNGYYAISSRYGNVKQNLNVHGGTFTGSKSALFIDNQTGVDSGETRDIAVSGGTFSSEIPEEVCKDGFIVTANADGTYGVKEGKYVAQIGDVKYTSLQDAVSAAAEGQIITLIADVNEAIENNNVHSFTINTANHTWTSDNYTLKNNGGTITLEGEGTVKSTGAEGIAVWARTGSIVINGGNYENCSNSESTVYVGTTDTNLAGKQPIITINGGTFKNTATGQYKWNAELLPLTLNIINNIAEADSYQAIVINGGKFYGNDPAFGDDSQLNKVTKNSNFVTSEFHAEKVNGVYEIKEGGYVAQVGYHKYVTFETAAAEGNDIILLDNVTVATLDVINGKHIEKNGHNVTVTLFTLIDGAAANIPFDFVAATAKYERSVGGNAWGTICVPFTLKSNSDYTLYEVESLDASTLTVKEAVGNVAPGQPVIFKKNDAVDNVTFTTTDANVVNGAPKSDTHLVGTYESRKLTSPLENIYFINGDAFHQAKASLTVPAYRAYINYSVPGAKSSVLNLHIAGNEADGIEAVMLDELNTAAFYDANGRQLPAPQKGMNIMKLANGKTMKLILK